jgi:hypothetical protein
MQTIPAAGKLKYLSGNSNRVSLICACDNATLFRISTNGSAPGTDAFISGFGTLSNAYPFRDYGPIIQGEIWIENPAASAITLTVTEVFRLGSC